MQLDSPGGQPRGVRRKLPATVAAPPAGPVTRTLEARQLHWVASVALGSAAPGGLRMPEREREQVVIDAEERARQLELDRRAKAQRPRDPTALIQRHAQVPVHCPLPAWWVMRPDTSACVGSDTPEAPEPYPIPQSSPGNPLALLLEKRFQCNRGGWARLKVARALPRSSAGTLGQHARRSCRQMRRL